MAWAHVLQQQSAMGNPFEFREMMKAAFGFIDKTVDEVLAEQKQRNAEREKPGRGRRTREAPTTQAKPRQSELDKLQALLAMGKPPAQTTSE